MLPRNSRHPRPQTCTNVFHGSELLSDLPEIHKLSNYSWHKTGPEKGQAEELNRQAPLQSCSALPEAEAGQAAHLPGWKP